MKSLAQLNLDFSSLVLVSRSLTYSLSCDNSLLPYEKWALSRIRSDVDSVLASRFPGVKKS